MCDSLSRAMDFLGESFNGGMWNLSFESVLTAVSRRRLCGREVGTFLAQSNFSKFLQLSKKC
jgi:hypothetical protein